MSTLNRIDALETCVSRALSQTRPPAEIVIVDASDDWDGNRARITALTDAAGMALHYLRAPRRSLTAQRNVAVAQAKADICFLIDDDAFMWRDCAAEIMRVYEADGQRQLVAVSASDAPPEGDLGDVGARKDGGLRDKAATAGKKSWLFRFLWRELFLMSGERVFVPYAGPFRRGLPADLRHNIRGIHPVTLIGGYRLTARRKVLLAEPFDDALQAYCPAEDLDASYRLSRHGYLAAAQEARLYHHEVAASRLKRRTALILSITNVAYFVRKNSRRINRHRLAFGVMLSRRLLAEFLKDGLSRRWRFDQFRGAVRAIPTSARILFMDRARLKQWYQKRQLHILAGGGDDPARHGPRGCAPAPTPPALFAPITVILHA